jgi:hypothetical protein
MTILILLAQLATLEKGIEAGAKESKPVVVFVHRNDWKGAEAVEKGLKESLGDFAGKVVLAHVNVQENEAAIKTYELVKLDGAITILDPKLKAAPTQQLARIDRDEELAPAGIKAATEKALKKFGEQEACRKAIDTFRAAMKKEDLAAFKSSLWPAAVEAAPEAIEKLFQEGVPIVKAWEGLEYVSVEERKADSAQKRDATVEAVFKVRVVLVKKEKKDGTSFEVVRTKKGSFVVPER